MEYKKVDINKLKVLDKNPRKISTAEFEKLKASIIADPEFLNLRPILVNIVNGQFIVYGGAQRLSVCRALNMLTVPCAIETDLDQRVMDFRMLNDNIHAGEWNFTGIKVEVFKPETIKEVEAWGFLKGETVRSETNNSEKERIANNSLTLDLNPKLPGDDDNEPETAKKERKGTLQRTLHFETVEQFDKLGLFLEYLRKKYPSVDSLDEKFLLFLLDWKEANDNGHI